MIEGGPKRYSGLGMLLHWLIAIAVIVQWRIAESAEYAERAEGREAHNAIMANHFGLGIVILLLALVWLAVHVFGSPPGRPASHAAWERILTRTVHTLFWVLLIVMPLAGWFAMSKYGAPIDVFGVFSVPPLPVAPDEAGAKAIFESHALAGTILLGLMVVHILGTLKHTFLDRDGNIFRMLPFGQPKA